MSNPNFDDLQDGDTFILRLPTEMKTHLHKMCKLQEIQENEDQQYDDKDDQYEKEINHLDYQIQIGNILFKNQDEELHNLQGDSKKQKEMDTAELTIYNKNQVINRNASDYQYFEETNKLDTTEKLKFMMKNDFKFNSDTDDLNTEAYALKTRKREKKRNWKMRCRIKRTLRLKPVPLSEGQITEKIMQGHNPEQATKFLPEKQGVKENYDPWASDDEGCIRIGENRDNESSSDEIIQSRLYDRRVAKDIGEMRQDILNIYKEKDIWTWDEIKTMFSDQPEAPLRQCLLEICNNIPGTGNGAHAKYELKPAFQ